MLKWVIDLSLRHRAAVVVIAMFMAIYGIKVTQEVKLDVFPEFAPPLIVIQTEAAGLSAEEVEVLVTRPVENGIRGTADLEKTYSQSIEGLSVVTAVFRDKADIYRVRQLIAERLVEIASQLPQGVSEPRMEPLTSSTGLALVVGLTSNERNSIELRAFADWTLEPQLLEVPGVARLETFGGEVRQLQVQIKPDRLLAYGLSIGDVLAAANKATGVRGAGFIENDNQRIVIRTKGQAVSLEEIREASLGYHSGFGVRLKDVANIVEAGAPKIGDGLVMGKSGVVMLIYSQYGANIPAVTRGLETTLQGIKSQLAAEKITLHPQLFRPANFIDASIRNINDSLLIGAALVVVVLFLFLANFRSAFIAFTTIPLSLLAAMIVLNWQGVSLNTLTLGGFAISIGVVVDDAVIGLENVWRRLRENRALENPRLVSEVVLEATLEVRSPIVYATIIVAAVFWPVLMMSGVNGRLFVPLAQAFILATLASLVVAITLTPALCALMMARATIGEPAYILWLKQQHRRALERVLRRPKTVIGATLMVCAGAAAAMPLFGGEFLPDFKEGHYILHVLATPGTSIPASRKIGVSIADELLENPHIKSISQEIGRAEQGEDTMGPEFSEFHVELKAISGKGMNEVKDEIRSALEKIPGINYSITPFLQERMEEVLGGQGEVVINVFGEDLDLIGEKAHEIAQLVRTIPGVKDVLVEAQSGSPELAISLRKDRLLQLGFNSLDVLDAIQTAYQGTVAGQVYDRNRVFDLAVILDPAMRKTPETVGDLLVRNAAGHYLPLRELADVDRTTGRYVVIHENARRRIQVTCGVEGRDVTSLVNEIQKMIRSKVTLPANVAISYSGAAEAVEAARNELLFNSLAAGVVIVLLLSIVLENPWNVVLVLANLPFALAGGVLMVLFTGGSVSVGSLVGFVSLFGISMRNSILMISHYETLVVKEGFAWGTEAAIRGATERLVPILMTALVVALGLLPIALGSNQPGKEIEGPMAIVILGGLATSTTLNLLVLPTLALRYGQFTTKLIKSTSS